MLNKKSQFKMFETIAILVVFFFILIIGLSFYSSVERKSLGKAASEFKQIEDIEKALLISNFPELECPTSLETENCIDIYKLEVLKNKNLDKDYYYDFFEYSEIIVEEIYPGNNVYSIYENKKGESYSQIQVPVSLYSATDKTKGFGVLIIKSYG